jgi:hypothetical protein
MKRCTRCILPETVPGISFNIHGVCCFCTDYQNLQYSNEEELQKLVGLIKKEDNEYDCIVPLSGGRDSTFVLYMAKAVYDLKVLAVNYDNEFRIDQALINMQNSCKALDVDFISVRSKRNVAQKIVLNAIRIALPQGLDEISQIFCFACAYGYRSVVWRAAEKYKVPLILWGSSNVEKSLDIKERMIVQTGISKPRKLFNIYYYKHEYYKLLQRLEFPVSGNSIFFRGIPTLKNKNIKEISFFDYVPWDRKKIKETIMKELGWRKPPNRASTWRIDCMLHDFLNCCFYYRFGCTKDCFGYFNMINSGQMNRAEALVQEGKMVKTITKNIRELLKNKIGLSEKEVLKIEAYQSDLGKKYKFL